MNSNETDFPESHGNLIFWPSVDPRGPNRSLERGGQYLSLVRFSSSEDLYLRSYGRLKLSEKIEKNLESSLKQILLRSPRNRNLRKNSWCFKKKFMSNGLFFRTLTAVKVRTMTCKHILILGMILKKSHFDSWNEDGGLLTPLTLNGLLLRMSFIFLRLLLNCIKSLNILLNGAESF